ncbi:thioredoxin domain-containing protein [uncultured Bilophila sp.]|nr:thioredoxin domain-containing protein [uncultured Bilophila sp.]
MTIASPKHNRTEIPMKRKLLWAFLLLWLLLTAYLLFLSNKWASAATPSYAASTAVTTENFADLLRETLQKNPDLLLSVLRENSEAVLDIAQEGSNQKRHKALLNQWKAELNQPKKVDIAGRPFRGAADAPVTVVAFSDFTCPYCQQAAATMQKVLQDNQGKIKYVFKHFPLESTGIARMAAEYHVAASRQSPELAWRFYDLLFAGRAEVLKDGEPAILKAAQEAGLNMKKLAADVKKKDVRAEVDADVAEGQALGVQGTPYFLINNLVARGALSSELFKEAINMALQAAPSGQK